MALKKTVCVAGVLALFLSTAAFTWNETGKDDGRKPAALSQADWQRLRGRVQREYGRFKGTASIVIKDLSTGWEITINKSQMMPAASIVKTPIMAGCFKAIEDGKLSLQEEIRLESGDKTPGSGKLKAMPSGSVFTVEQLIELMIAESDNTATNILIDRLSADYLNAFFRRQGLNATCLRRKMMDFSRRSQGVENYTSAGDISLLLEKIYRGTCVNQKVSQKCMDMLLRQKLRDRIPKKLPKDTPVAHKTGLERNVCHDAGVVFAPEGDFLICVLTKSKAGPGVMKDFIAKVALSVYNNYSPEPVREVPAAAKRTRTERHRHSRRSPRS
jgi:beta-lactamase class A